MDERGVLLLAWFVLTALAALYAYVRARHWSAPALVIIAGLSIGYLGGIVK